MSIEAMKQALEYTRPGAIVPVTPETVKMLVDALRLAIEQAERECCCGEPDAPSVVHRTDGPCYMAERQKPFGYFIHDSQFGSEDFSRLKPEAVNPTETVIALYTAPPQQEKQEPVAWLQFRDNLLPLVAPRGLGTPVYTAPLPSFGIRGGLAHDQEKQNE